MTDNHQAIATLPISSAKRLDRVNELMGVLAGFRPTGMTDELASDWAAVVIADTRNLSDAQFQAACDAARYECDDYKQVRKVMLSADAAKPNPALQWASEWEVEAIEQAKTAPRLPCHSNDRIGDAMRLAKGAE